MAGVTAVLLPIWAEKRDTARRMPQRISGVMRWTAPTGGRTHSNADATS